MQTIICKKCGAVINASLGECPVCGAVYYILPEDDAAQNAAPSQRPLQSQTAHDPVSFENIGSEDIFNTHILKSDLKGSVDDDLDATRAFTPATPPEERPSRPAAPTPTRTAPPPQRNNYGGSGNGNNYGNRNYSANGNTPNGPEHDIGKRKLVIWAIALLALLTLVLTLMSGAFNFSGETSDKDKMVNVVGQIQEMATSILEQKGLVVKPIYQTSNETKGTVIDQSIKEGKKIKKGQEVTITVSSGPKETEESPEVKTATVPSLKGKSYDQALYEATAAGLVLTTSESKYDDKAAADTVLSQSPAAGTTLKEGDIVTVTLSKGPEPTPSPSNNFTITAIAGIGGSISPKGFAEVDEGGEISFTITPDSGFTVKEVKVDGNNVGAVTSYTFSNVTDNHTIYVVFQLSSSSDDNETT